MTLAVTPTPITPSTSSATQSEFITKGELHNIFKVEIEKANKVVVAIDFQFPYPAHILAKPYPKDFINPRFRKFDGKRGNAKEHVVGFLGDLVVYASDQELILSEFSKSIIDRAYS